MSWRDTDDDDNYVIKAIKTKPIIKWIQSNPQLDFINNIINNNNYHSSYFNFPWEMKNFPNCISEAIEILKPFFRIKPKGEFPLLIKTKKKKIIEVFYIIERLDNELKIIRCNHKGNSLYSNQHRNNRTKSIKSIIGLIPADYEGPLDSFKVIPLSGQKWSQSITFEFPVIEFNQGHFSVNKMENKNDIYFPPVVIQDEDEETDSDDDIEVQINLSNKFIYEKLINNKPPKCSKTTLELSGNAENACIKSGDIFKLRVRNKIKEFLYLRHNRVLNIRPGNCKFCGEVMDQNHIFNNCDMFNMTISNCGIFSKDEELAFLNFAKWKTFNFYLTKQVEVVFSKTEINQKITQSVLEERLRLRMFIDLKYEKMKGK